MTRFEWQKSSFSSNASSCVNIAAGADGALRLRESDDPEVVLAARPTAVRGLIRALKDRGSATS